MPDHDVVRLAIVGAGNRGGTYARLAAATGAARVTAVADPRRARAKALAADVGVDPGRCFDDWRELLARPDLADAVAVTTLDADHVEPAVTAAAAGLHLLLEKPMATTDSDCVRIVEAVERAGVVCAVCHVMRYTPYSRALAELLASGRIGQVVGVEHLEPVGWWHQAHSFVRGNWRREDEGSPMLMAKSCHDIDWLAGVVGARVRRVSSFGGLFHFRPEHRPEGAADRCLDCAVERACPYSAKKIYLERPLEQRMAWPVSVVSLDPGEEAITRALREGPYGRCVYDCDNDVVDHQVVNLEYEGGVTASFTMTAFTEAAHRKTRIFGTHGRVEGDGVHLSVMDFRDRSTETIDTMAGADATAAGGHGGGDAALVDAFLRAVRTGDRRPVLTSPRDSLASHQVVWAAERARRTGTVVTLD
ncbi:MAG: Gfo/Idh/MocA family oxidoreductase [Streptosporangiales bacterium]|nr:Gfo/Idh/MocA family oxidoreductase [Streptosporangiales bacterium]MBO0889523.1 Gfo/Idh/MocA family oxidoreductase [Acidothermales bacterium]